MLYWACGSNLHKERMLARCPDAEAIRAFVMPGTQLVFRGVADVIAAPDIKCPGGLWRITSRCERALDRYEGFDAGNPDRGMYAKEYVQLEEPAAEGETGLMYYVMNSTGIYPPSEGYYQTIKDGYRDFGLKLAPLKKALAHSWDAKHPTHIERRRTRRNGRPALARRNIERKQSPHCQ